MLHLCAAQRCINVGHPIVVADMVVYKLPTVRYLGLGGDMFGQFAQFFIVEQEHTAATRGDGLVAVETQGPDFPECSRMPAVVETADAVYMFEFKLDKAPMSSIVQGCPNVCIGTQALIRCPVFLL